VLHCRRLWKTEVALLEASASVGLEGERISTAGMVMRLTSNLESRKSRGQRKWR
jgi:hypothetical protein